ncbi:lysoplasmalogenase family protein [Clostridium vincentii]
MVLYFKYVIMISLFLWAITMKKEIQEQKIMSLSFLFLVFADFFLVFVNTIDFWNKDFSTFGAAGFLISYICLIVAYQKNFKIGKQEILAALPILSIFIYVIISLRPYITGFMLLGALIFMMVLCYMTWTSICTIFRGYFTLKSAWIIAVSGSLMFICDIGVAFSKFKPIYSGIHVLWLTNIIWATYIPGWTLLAVIISEKNINENVRRLTSDGCKCNNKKWGDMCNKSRKTIL